ncbi:MAG: beta-ketoacyl reductase, partial [Gemmatimonadales bacterium]
GIASALQTDADSPRLMVMTREAVAVGASDRAHAAQAALWGVGRSVALEASPVWGGLVDLERTADRIRAASAVAGALAGADDEDQVAWRGGIRMVPRLVRDSDPAPASLPVRERAAYLITGAFGGLGPKLIRWMARSGARELVLVGRTAPRRDQWGAIDPESAAGRSIAAIREVEAAGVSCVTVAADVGDRAAMGRIFEEARGRAHPIRGVIHAAASIRFQPLAGLNSAALDEALHAKASGTLVLDALSRDGANDFLILFSSGTTILGASRLGAYAAANQYLAAVAQERSRAGYPVTVVDWGAWDEIRLLGSDGAETMSELGFEVLQDERALSTLAGLVANGTSHRFVAALDTARLRDAYQVHRRRPLLDGLGKAQGLVVAHASDGGPADAAPSLEQLIAGLEPGEALERLTEFVAATVARVLGVGVETLDRDRGLFDLGLDSLMAVGLRNRLEAAGAGSLPATLVFNYPTATAIAGLLSSRLGVAAGSPSPASRGSAPEEPAASDEDVRAELLAQLKAIDLGVDT